VSDAVLDASVAVKWLVEEEDSRQAELLLSEADRLHAPELWALEIGNVLTKLRRRGLLSAPVARSGWERVLSAGVLLYSDGALAEAAFALAGPLDISMYDASYLALAERMGIPLVTADERFYDRVIAGAARAPVVLLRDWRPG
jgi:predicted nucleic acid-binding protein